MSSDRRDLYNGFGDTYTRAFELVVTPTVFGIMGWWLDGRFDTSPVLALTLGVTVFLYEIWKLTKVYMARSAVEDRKVLGGRDV